MSFRFAMTLVLLAGCGREDGALEGNASANQIERLSTPSEEEGDPLTAVRLQPLEPSDVEREGLLGAGCAFSVGGQLLLAATGGDAIVRMQDGIRHLVPSGPIGPTGGFFEDRQLSISVGRSGPAGRAVAEGSSRPARITVTHRRAELEQAHAGAWTCGA
ncbi:hypothetical protein [Sphingosinicella sp. CPCC 101087]|uniref:hypothetical protein n=1 Tax=Sphingosinicella sp. CPCC 101087 TaxID=2497754 RepID=UPI00101C7493|nr:hypothetical protein [Sphingosinicella sp. CPCC 101087]